MKTKNATKTLRFHKDYNISATSLVKPLSLCVFVAEKGLFESTQLNNPLLRTASR
jgi:hypothetical protein